jgi:hypothetical protein
MKSTIFTHLRHQHILLSCLIPANMANYIILISFCSSKNISPPVIFGAEVINLSASVVANYNHVAINVENANSYNITITYARPGQNDKINIESWLPLKTRELLYPSTALLLSRVNLAPKSIEVFCSVIYCCQNENELWNALKILDIESISITVVVQWEFLVLIWV